MLLVSRQRIEGFVFSIFFFLSIARFSSRGPLAREI